MALNINQLSNACGTCENVTCDERLHRRFDIREERRETGTKAKTKQEQHQQEKNYVL